MDKNWLEVELTEGEFWFESYLDAVRRQTMTLAVGMYDVALGDPRLQAVKWWRKTVQHRVMPQMSVWCVTFEPTAKRAQYQTIIEEVAIQLVNEARRLSALQEETNQEVQTEPAGESQEEVAEEGGGGRAVSGGSLS